MSLHLRRAIILVVTGAIAAPAFACLGEAGLHLMDSSEGPLATVVWAPLIAAATIRGLLAGVGIAISWASFDPSTPRLFLRDWLATASVMLFWGAITANTSRHSIPVALAGSLIASAVIALLFVLVFRFVSWVIARPA